MNDVTKISGEREHYGEQLRIRRNRLGLTQEYIAQQLHITQPQVSNLEQIYMPTKLGREYNEVLSNYELRFATQLVVEHPEVIRDPRVRRAAWHMLVDELLTTVFPDEGTAATPAVTPRRSPTTMTGDLN